MENYIVLNGEVVSGFRYDHEVFGEEFYTFDLKTKRLSDAYDVITVMVSERLINVKEDLSGKYVKVKGEFRSYNKHIEEHCKLVLFAFAKTISVVEECDNENSAEFDGFICKQPNFRKTPLGREITDLLLAVNRPYGKSDYIPLIVWGRNASYVAELPVGTRLNIFGRIQSREYKKVISETESVTKIAYEVSVNKLNVVKE